MNYDELYKKYQKLLTENKKLKEENSELKKKLRISITEEVFQIVSNAGINLVFQNKLYQHCSIIDQQIV